MPTSYKAGKRAAARWITENFSGKPVIDVGAGVGTYADLIPWTIDAIEIHEPYIHQYRLNDKYRHVYAVDLREFNRWGDYHLAIFGDVIEHLPIADAQAALSRVGAALVAVPFQFAQGVVNGNEHERHFQDDLTCEIFEQRYPGFTRLWISPRYGYWIRQ